ncbi:type IX secretion system membrane protein PorP/SprF [candidate division KSB1 bacterium]|nr:type IX secretion system membrane protein PorP/SprF [candidate division KSB1 bacterium]
MTKTRSQFAIIISFVLLLTHVILPVDASSQNIIFTNPADIHDPRANFVNPAMISYQGSQTMLGMKAFHVGFLEGNAFAFKNGYLSVSSPYIVKSRLGLGINAQFFNTPLYQQTSFSLAASHKFFGIFSLGARVNIFTKSYDRSKFDLVESDDPVFSKDLTKYSASFGTGIMLVPVPNLYLAAGVDHINQPNVALSSQPILQPMEFNFGMKYIFSSLSSSIYFRGTRSKIIPFFEAERNFSDYWKAKLCYGMKTLQISGLVNLGAGISLGYEYHYPFSDLMGTSFGSYSLCIVYNTDTIMRLPQEIRRSCKQITFEIPQNKMKLQPRFVVYSSVNALEILEKQITRVFDDSLSKDEFTALTNFELGTLDSNTVNSPLYFQTSVIDAYYPEIKRVGHFTKLYKTALDSISRLIKEDESLKVEIISTKGVTNRAAGLRNYLKKAARVSEDQITVSSPIYKSEIDSLHKNQRIVLREIADNESLVAINHRRTTFYIVPINTTGFKNKWALTIQNSSGEIVREFSGEGNIPEKITWDWKDRNGHFIQPDLYTYCIKWIGESGQMHVSNPRIIDVQKIKRHLKIRITKKANFNKDGVKKYGLKLNR